jgi:hypothetical protein
VIIRKDRIEQMQKMVEAFQDGLKPEDAQKKTFSVFDEAKLRKQAAEMGEGVKYVSGEKITKGDTCTLAVKMPPADLHKQPKQQDKMAEGEMMTAIMKQIMGGMKATIAIEIEGAILKTNATQRDGNRLTIMETDFDKIAADEKAFKKLNETEPESFEEMQKLGNAIPGIKIDENKEPSVEFK